MAITSSPASRCSSSAWPATRCGSITRQQQQLKASAPISQPCSWPIAAARAKPPQAFAKIAKDAPSGYAATAKLAEADALLAAGQDRRRRCALQAGCRKRNSGAWRRGAHPRRPGRWPTQRLEKRSADFAGAADRPTIRRGASWPARFSPIAIIATASSRRAQREYETPGVEADAPARCASAPAPWRRSSAPAADANYGTVPPPPKPRLRQRSERKHATMKSRPFGFAGGRCRRGAFAWRLLGVPTRSGKWFSCRTNPSSRASAFR